MKRLGAVLKALGFWALFALILLTVLENSATNAGLYRELQLENGLPEDAGLTLDEMVRIDEMLADYLSGNASALDASPFNERELLHMRDVFDLFGLLRAARNALIPAAILLLITGLWLTRGQGSVGASLVGLALLVLPIAAFGIWAAVDFRAAFDAFHRTFFRNDLWILEPATDLLIRLCPERFFADFAAVIAVRAGLVIAAVPLAIFGARFGRRFL